MKKLLVIGQAPPSQKQEVPYDTTLLYDWFGECGITKEEAQDLFEFDAVSDKFPGFAEGGGHLVPSLGDMQRHMQSKLRYKIEEAESIIVLGGVARDFLNSDSVWNSLSPSRRVLYLMHPSRMNYNRYLKNKQLIIHNLKTFIDGTNTDEVHTGN
jgi:hypothetical protein